MLLMWQLTTKSCKIVKCQICISLIQTRWMKCNFPRIEETTGQEHSTMAGLAHHPAMVHLLQEHRSSRSSRSSRSTRHLTTWRALLCAVQNYLAKIYPLTHFPHKAVAKRNTSPAFEWAGRWKLPWCWPGFGLALLLYLHDISLFDPKKMIYFELLRGRGCVESKNMTSAKRKSTMSSLNPSIIQVGSFKRRADVPLYLFFLQFP